MALWPRGYYWMLHLIILQLAFSSLREVRRKKEEEKNQREKKEKGKEKNEIRKENENERRRRLTLANEPLASYVSFEII